MANCRDPHACNVIDAAAGNVQTVPYWVEILLKVERLHGARLSASMPHSFYGPIILEQSDADPRCILRLASLLSPSSARKLPRLSRTEASVALLAPSTHSLPHRRHALVFGRCGRPQVPIALV